MRQIKVKNCLVALAASIFLAFGLYHVHSFSGVTEGGVLGMTLLLKNWFNLSPSVSGAVMNLCCYLLGWKLLGKKFVVYSLISTAGFSGAYKLFERTEPLWPELYRMPLVAAVVGAVFVGIGVGLCVRMGGAPTGDDALAMSLSRLIGCKIQWVYLISDLVVLILSVTYIPLNRLGFSLLTVVLSGQLIGLVQKIGVRGRKAEPAQGK